MTLTLTLVKRCLGDGDTQPPHIQHKSEFSPDARRPDKLCPYCKECNAARQRRWKHQNKDKVREAKRAYREKQKELNDL